MGGGNAWLFHASEWNDAERWAGTANLVCSSRPTAGPRPRPPRCWGCPDPLPPLGPCTPGDLWEHGIANVTARVFRVPSASFEAGSPLPCWESERITPPRWKLSRWNRVVWSSWTRIFHGGHPVFYVFIANTSFNYWHPHSLVLRDIWCWWLLGQNPGLVHGADPAQQDLFLQEGFFFFFFLGFPNIWTSTLV